MSQRTDLSNPVIGDAHRETFLAAGDILQKIGVIKPEVSVPETINALIDTSYLADSQKLTN